MAHESGTYEIDTKNIDRLLNEIDAAMHRATSTPVDVRPDRRKADQLRNLMRGADLCKLLESEIKNAYWLAKGEHDPRVGGL